MSKLLMIRADSSETIGGGHIMRCLAVAAAWRDLGGDSLFVAAEISDELRTRILREGHQLEDISAPRGSQADAAETCQLAKSRNAKAVAMDGYCFELDYQKYLHQEGIFTVKYDDQGVSPEFECDILVNQNVHAKDIHYRDRAPNAKLLMGAGYAAIREEFRTAQNQDRDYSSPSNILISLGLSDTTEQLETILKGLNQWQEPLQITLLAGGADMTRLDQFSMRDRHELRLFQTIEDMAAAFLKADLAILAAGGTANEAACLATPFAVLCIADNQIPAYEEYVASDAALDGGYARNLTPETLLEILRPALAESKVREELGRKARSKVDGQGASRVAQAIWQA